MKAFDILVGLTSTADGGTALATTKQPTGPTGQGNPFDNTDAFVAKLSRTATVEWTTTHSGKTTRVHTEPGSSYDKYQECLYDIVQAPDGGFVIAGNNSSNLDDFYVVRFGDLGAPPTLAAPFVEHAHLVYPEGSQPFATALTGDVRVRPYGELWVDTGRTIEFEQGARLLVGGKLQATGAELTAQSPSQGWRGMVVFDGAELDFDGLTVSHAEVGAEVLSNDGVVIANTLFTDNGVGVLGDYIDAYCEGAYCSGLSLQPERSAFALSESCVTEGVYEPVQGLNFGYGVWARHADVEMDRTTIENNGAYGMFIDDGDIGAYRLLVQGNGESPIASELDGIRVSGNGGLTLASYPIRFSARSGEETQGDASKGALGIIPGTNSIRDNVENEISIEAGGYVYVGDLCNGSLCPTTNRVSEAGPLGPDMRLIENLSTKDEVSAERTFWATTPADPPDVAFENPGLVEDYSPLPFDPATTAGVPGGCVSVGALHPSGGAGLGRNGGTLASLGVQAGAKGGLDPELAEWLRARLRTMREALQENPGSDTAAALVHALYAFQRTDRADVLGVHAQTMGALGRLRARLAGDGPLSPALRAAAEAALVATVHDALRRGRYEQARAHLDAFGPRVEGERTQRALALAAVSLDEAAGDYESALGRVEALLAGVDPEAPLARDLEATAALLAGRLGLGGRPAPRGGTSAVPPTSSRGTDAEGTAEVFETALGSAYPNPLGGAHARAVVPLTLASRADVRVAVYDVLGREVAVLAEQTLEAGRHEVAFGAGALPAGVYVVRATVHEGGGPGGMPGGVRTFTARLTLIE